MVMKLVFVLPVAISRQHPQGREMRSRLLTGLLILSFITLPGPSEAEKMNEAFEVMPGCRALLAQLAESRLGQGYCLGYVAALVDSGHLRARDCHIRPSGAGRHFLCRGSTGPAARAFRRPRYGSASASLAMSP